MLDYILALSIAANASGSNPEEVGGSTYRASHLTSINVRIYWGVAKLGIAPHLGCGECSQVQVLSLQP